MESINDESVLSLSTEIIKDKFYFGILNESVQPSEKWQILNTDSMFPYSGYCKDFGPLNIAQINRYSEIITNILKKNKSNETKLLHYAFMKKKINILNSAFLIGSFQILNLNKTDKEAYQSLSKYSSLLMSYIDASNGSSNYFLSLEDCLSGIYRAFLKKIYRYDLFDVAVYEHFDKLENGDLNWIICNKILAFSGPENDTFSKDQLTHSPEVYIPYFRYNNVGCIIRLNEKRYSSEIFKRAGIDHFDLYFADGDTPSKKIVKQFLTICNRNNQAIAIHCAAGLGRTGTLIAYYLMYFHGFSAAESIAWVRICRPGSILGKQQLWLTQKEKELSKRNILSKPLQNKLYCKHLVFKRALHKFNMKYSSLSSAYRLKSLP